MRAQDVQPIIDVAVATATRKAMAGQPVSRIVWTPPDSPMQDPRGTFCITPCPPLSGSDRAPWD